jgi:xylulokinase
VSLYLGLDSSTQSLTGVVIEIGGRERRVAWRGSLNFDVDLPEYGTRNGILPGDDPRVAISSPVLWAAALERLMSDLREASGLDLSRLRGISGAGQQHGSVYLNGRGSSELPRLDPTRPLAKALESLLSRAVAPIWLDASTTRQCEAISAAVGGPTALARLTGSRAFERFTGPQIRKFSETDPDGWAATDRVHLVSSFLASLLIGGHAPIESGDGAGMNLMDLAGKRWAPVALDATAPDLRRRLPPIVEPWSVIGTLSPYWVERFGFPPAQVVAWTGDNPSALVGIGLVDTDRTAISLGTSDTVFRLTREIRVDPSGGSHTFGAPTGDYMVLVCFSNGSLTREHVLREAGVGWDRFRSVLDATRPGNGGAILLPWFSPEITPPVGQPGARRYALDPSDGPANVRAVMEAQMMATAVHSEWIGPRADIIHATGGASRNRDILQVMADVHGAEVHRYEAGESAALGAALRAFHGVQRAAGRPVEWPDVLRGFAEPVDEPVRPDPANVQLYDALKRVYIACEAHALDQGPEPAELIDAFRSEYGGSAGA